MAVYLGNNKITFDGISEIYVGSNKVYSATPPGPPVIDNPVNEYFCVYSANSFTISFEKVQTTAGSTATLNYNNLKLKYSTNKTNWTEVSAAHGFNFNGGTLYYIYTSSADVGTTTSSTDLGMSSASWGQVCSAPAYGYYSYTCTRMNFSGTSTIYLMGNIRTIAQGNQATPYNSYVGSKTKIDCVSTSASSSSYSIYYTRACGLGSSTYQNYASPYSLKARGIKYIQGTSNSTIDISNLFIGDHEDSSYPTFSYSTGTPYTPPYDPHDDYFYVENTTSSAITLTIKKSSNSAPTITVYRSTDKTTWTSMGSTSTSGITYGIPANSKLYLKATVNSWCTSSYYNSITCSGNHAVGGNIMSLLYGDSFIGKTIFPSSSTYNFSRLFWNSTYLKNIDNLVLPATTLTANCYNYMFRGCTGITSIPSNFLPATTLADNCYQNMFYNCTGITSISSNFLPATTLTNYCYNAMFMNCSNLVNSPELPATTVKQQCYQFMFYGCSNLVSAPDLPAATLAISCYGSMFYNCTKLDSIRISADDISASTCLNYWLYGVSSTGTFHNLGSATYPTGESGIPSGWSEVNT